MTTPLQRAIDEAAGLPVDFCTVCCGPSSRTPLAVLLEDG